MRSHRVWNILLIGSLWLYSVVKGRPSFTGWLRTVWRPLQDAHEHEAIRRKSQDRFLFCDPELFQITTDYFESHKAGIDGNMVGKALVFSQKINTDQRGLAHIQVVNGTIYLNRSQIKGYARYEEQRLEFFLEGLDSFLAKRERLCSSRPKNILCLPEKQNFELVLVLRIMMMEV